MVHLALMSSLLVCLRTQIFSFASVAAAWNWNIFICVFVCVHTYILETDCKDKMLFQSKGKEKPQAKHRRGLWSLFSNLCLCIGFYSENFYHLALQGSVSQGLLDIGASSLMPWWGTAEDASTIRGKWAWKGHSEIFPAAASWEHSSSRDRAKCVLPRQVRWKDMTFEEGWGLTRWKKGFARSLPQHGQVRSRAGETGFGWVSGAASQKGAGLTLASLGKSRACQSSPAL